MESTFLIVVVIYEISLENSVTFQKLLKLRENGAYLPDLLIYDNSLASKYDKRYEDWIEYYNHSKVNVGVGGAYNYAMQLAGKLKKDWLILLDQDSDMGDRFFSQLFGAVRNYPDYKLFCPTVISHQQIVSPSYLFFQRPFFYRKPKTGERNSRYYTAINSGLVINLNVMEKLGGFDTDLPLDYSDHYFFYKFKKANKQFYVIDSVIQHDLSAHNETDFAAVFNRFKMYRNSSIIYSQKIGSLFPLLWVALRTLKLTIKFSKIEFIKFLLFKK